MRIYLSTPERVHHVTVELSDAEIRTLRSDLALMQSSALALSAYGALHDLGMKLSAVLP